MTTETERRKFNFNQGAYDIQSLQNILELEVDKPGLSGTFVAVKIYIFSEYNWMRFLGLLKS
jgi:hypothetical protein